MNPKRERRAVTKIGCRRSYIADGQLAPSVYGFYYATYRIRRVLFDW